MESLESIQGSVEHIIYRNPDNGYTVLNLVTEDGDEIILVGMLQAVEEGIELAAEGRFVYHAKYGEQFQAEKCAIHEPTDKESILRYLAAGSIKGIGPALAKRIVKKFGEDTFRIMEEEPERLAEVKGISMNKAQDIALSFEEKTGMRRAMIFLQQYGISNRLALKIYEKYHERVYAVVAENPYRMTEEVEGVGFKTADDIAQRGGIDRHSDFRIRSGVLYALTLAEGEGNIYLPKEELLQEAAALLAVEQEAVEEQLADLAMNRRIVVKNEHDESRIYLKSLYQVELDSARRLMDLDLKEEVHEKELAHEIENIEHKNDIVLADEQRKAVEEAVVNGVFVMTGGPGTGKTTTIKVLLRYFLSKGMDVMLAAPTGRAAKRLTEAAGMEARTIHRMLEVSGGPQDNDNNQAIRSFARNQDNPLETDVVIVDEMSMVDIWLFHSLLSALAVGTKLIMVGDEHQLPSVGPGSVLKDIISSGCFKAVSLNRVFRQAEQSDIVMNAHTVLSGQVPAMDNKSKDFFFLNRNDPDQIMEGIVYLVSKKLPPYVQAAPSEIQVLTPMRKGVLGVENLNRRLQNALNPASPEKAEVESGDGILRLGDKVMQTRNNYQQEWNQEIPGEVLKRSGTGIFNGDTGTITEINRETGTVTVRFDDNRVAVYQPGERSELDLAYAITIHKSQGSEYPAVVMPLLSGPELLMNRNLFYTGITRARKCVMLIGRRDTIEHMIGNTREQIRYTSLKDRIIGSQGDLIGEISNEMQ
ncbi:exodeoxyribonuclease V alpha subunit [Lachnospiraceae bacterium]|nr:exodeoxyribonuclease V alpha subunit [Lachnospiraceae bacterium]